MRLSCLHLNSYIICKMESEYKYQFISIEDPPLPRIRNGRLQFWDARNKFRTVAVRIAGVSFGGGGAPARIYIYINNKTAHRRSL